MASPSPSARPTPTPHQYFGVGIALAVGSGALIGSSFVFKKKGLLASQKGGPAGEGVAYLMNAVWWIGMMMMIVGELFNAASYAFVSAIIVTPMGALSVVICAVLSSIFLKETLSLFGWIGCFQCITGSIIVALNAPQQQSVTTIAEFKHLFLAPGFLVFGGAIILVALVIVFFIAPKYGKKNMLWYIIVCSLFGGLSVSCTQGLGACIITSIRGENQFKNWFIYLLMAGIGFVAVTLVTEIYFLNMALALFNTAMVTPTYYVIFTGCTLLTTIVLYQGVKAHVAQILTVVFAFLIICSGITLLQISKIEPTQLRNLDRRTTILLQAAREEVAIPVEDDPEKSMLRASEEPGMDALRGTFGGIGTIVRARRRQSTIGDASSIHRSLSGANNGRRDTTAEAAREWENVAGRGVKRFQLHDSPVPKPATTSPPPSALKKWRDSHDSSAAVRGSFGVVDSDLGEIVDNHDENEEELSVLTLLAQQQWASQNSMGSEDPREPGLPPLATSSKTPSQAQSQSPGTKHTLIHFLDTPAIPSYRRKRSDLSNSIPPISLTPPRAVPSAHGGSSSGSSTSHPASALRRVIPPSGQPKTSAGSPLRSVSPVHTSSSDRLPGGATISYDDSPPRSVFGRRVPSSTLPLTMSYDEGEREENEHLEEHARSYRNAILVSTRSDDTEDTSRAPSPQSSSHTSVPSTEHSGMRRLISPDLGS
ncbi:hypothetical protein BS47DRAFT_1321551 [Hydnum rufescens UP504]|uniref:DUF803-domain-containing protein n=1 Tax=Hydnum rufescens UP504 TaxID=1448309 RepID=A0A9P6DLJ0_9AGAM|nr:hypothetical protein BS47DRAFT_1321551 [Hydnum rufescens UP504]